MKPENISPEVGKALHTVAYWIYERRGQDAVLEFADLLDLPHAYCEPCEWISPFVDDACLVCGSSYNPKVQKGTSGTPTRRRNLREGKTLSCIKEPPDIDFKRPAGGPPPQRVR